MPLNPNAGGFNPNASSWAPGQAKPAFDVSAPTAPPTAPPKPAFDARPPTTETAFDARPPTAKPAFDTSPPTSKPAFDARPPTSKPAFDARPPASISSASISSKPAASISSKPAASISSKPAASISSKPAPAAAPADEDEIDESDPLFMAILKIAEGDKERARRMVNDPDSLLKYPEIVKLMDESAPTSDMVTDEITSEVDAMKIDAAPASEAAAAAPVPMEEEEEEVVEVVEEGDPREHLNLVFIGHVDAGKSTLSGNILYLTDNVDKRTIERYEREAKDRNRESWFLAFIMDTNEEERAKGKTVEVGRAYFDTELKRYTVLDAPGHKNYVPNMIMGASQADVGVLVISARKGEFEAGFDRGGQSREHAMLCKTLGISHLVVAINKMDDPTVEWKKERFDECVTKLRPFLKSCGYLVKKEVKFIPISGLSGANVKDEVDPKVCPWWKESCSKKENNTNMPTLLSLFDSLEISGRNRDGPVVIPVLDRYSDRGTIAMGKVESGTVRVGQKVMVMPTRTTYKIEGVWANELPVKCARPGENVLVKIGGAGVEDVQKGFVICDHANPCRAVDKIIATVALVDLPDSLPIFSAGTTAIFHSMCIEEECTVMEIFETTNSKGVVTKNAKFAKVGMKVIMKLSLARSIPCDTFANAPFLGRFTLRNEGKTIAIGKITKLPPKKK